uniref:Transcriptional regulator/sugar kinase n=1 Tax=Desulfovibrio sp. U5L TaxID=596152 RepID=I2Q1U9_9BACT
MPTSPLPAFFDPAKALPSSLAAWRQAFAALPPDRSRPVELWCDRGELPPVVEAVRIPHPADGRVRQLAVLYLAALVNNVLCTRGAGRVSVVSDSDETAGELAAALERTLFRRLDSFSNMSLAFLFSLTRQVFGTNFVLDADRKHALSLRDRLRPQASGSRRPAAPPGPARPGTVLAVNIGQHLTSLALVRLDPTGGYDVAGLVRRDTWPAGGRQCLPAAWDGIFAEARAFAAASGRPVDAVGVSIAATTLAGVVHPVPEFGLFADCPPEEIDTANVLLRQACGRAFPGLPLAVVNDGEAQARFAFHHSHPPATGAALSGDMLSLRLGACPAVHCLDARGRPVEGLHEYGWLVTRYAPSKAAGSLFSTTRLYLSHYGVAAAAHDLGLLEHYRLPIEAAIPFFHDALVRNGNPAGLDAARVYALLGAHLGMLAHELDRNRPLAAIRLLGSTANKIDAEVFVAMQRGFSGFADRHCLPLGDIRLDLLEDTSSIAGLVGAAQAALAHQAPVDATG